VLGASLAAGFLYWLLRQMERWLQQHIFKVGWLVTKDFRTTTVLYYVFFLPGVILHEVVVWLAAGIFNVRADRATQFPQPQEVPELRLTFVRISPRAPKWKIAIINLAPTAAGFATVALIANGILDITPALRAMRTGDLDDIGRGLRLLTGTTDFWLWTYVLFTVANTMSPKLDTAREVLIRPLIIAAGAALVVILALGLLQDAVVAISVAFEQIFNVLAAVFAVTVAVNAAAIFLLAVIENSIERMTGDSATIDRNGKLVAKKRAEILAEREQERLRAMRARETAKAQAPSAVEGIPSIYRLPLPLPDAVAAARPVVMAPPLSPGGLEPPRHRPPDVIEATASVTVEPVDETDDQHEDAFSNVVAPARPQMPPSPAAKQQNELDSFGSAFDSGDMGEGDDPPQ
jgi:hypothetical protein